MTMDEKLLEELLELKARNRELEQRIVDLQIERDDLKINLQVEKNSRAEEKAHYERIIASHENGEILKQAIEDAEEYKICWGRTEEKLDEYIYKVEELETHNKNPFGAGRKTDKHLEVYLLNCWAREMTDQEIIGSEYQGFDGVKKVARASYYRAKKRLLKKRD